MSISMSEMVVFFHALSILHVTACSSSVFSFNN